MLRRGNFTILLAGAALAAAVIACAGAAPRPEAAAPQQTAPVAAIEATQGIVPPAPSSTAVITPQAASPAIAERRRVTLEYPEAIRAGDSDIIRLTLEVDDLGGITPTAMVEGNRVTGNTVEVPDLYATHNVIAEARLDMAGVELRPPETISSPLLPGETVTFYWSVRPESSGTFKGTAWLHLRFVDKVTGEASLRAVSAQVVEIHTAELLGLPAGFARTTGAVGSVVGGILGFPFVDDILKALFRRLRRK